MNILLFALIFPGALTSGSGIGGGTSDPAFDLTSEPSGDTLSELAASLYDFEADADFEGDELDFENFFTDAHPAGIANDIFDQSFPYFFDIIEPAKSETSPVIEESAEHAEPIIVAIPEIGKELPPDIKTTPRSAKLLLNTPLISYVVAKTANSCIRSSSSSSFNIGRSSRIQSEPKPAAPERCVQLPIQNEKELNANKRKRTEHENLNPAIAKRTEFNRRTPFIYKTTCDCKKRYFSYIALAIRHIEQSHNYSGYDYNGLIRIVDDFSVMEHYPLHCDLCPFRCNRQIYLDSHFAVCHANKWTV